MTTPSATAAPISPTANPFAETPQVRGKLRNELIARGIFAMMVICILIPLALILGYLINKGHSLLSWEFLTSNPVNGMRKGGIWSALLGTLWLVGVSLAIAAPIGIFAAV